MNRTMFTGIIQSIGTIAELQPKGGDITLVVNTGKLDMSDVELGDSIAVNGVCLTAVRWLIQALPLMPHVRHYP